MFVQLVNFINGHTHPSSVFVKFYNIQSYPLLLFYRRKPQTRLFSTALSTHPSWESTASPVGLVLRYTASGAQWWSCPGRRPSGKPLQQPNCSRGCCSVAHGAHTPSAVPSVDEVAGRALKAPREGRGIVPLSTLSHAPHTSERLPTQTIMQVPRGHMMHE